MFVDSFSVSASALAKMQHPVKGSHIVTGDIGGQQPYETIGGGLEELLVATECQETIQLEELEEDTNGGGEQIKKQIEKEARKQTKRWNKKLKKLVAKVFQNL